MKRILCVMTVFLFVAVLFACSAGNRADQEDSASASDFKNENGAQSKADFISLPKADAENPILPPVRISEKRNAHPLVKGYTLESAYVEADLICVVQIGNWLGEDLESYSTYFEAQIVGCFKGNAEGTITLIQGGCTERTFSGYPLFTYGNHLLLFLKEGEVPEYGKIYWILGSYSTVFDVAEVSPGEMYLVARSTAFAKEFSNIKNFKNELEVRTRLKDVLAEQDPVVYGDYSSLPYIFSVEDVRIQIRNLE